MTRLEDAVLQWVQAKYYLLRPWMHPGGVSATTMAMIEAEDGLLRAFGAEGDLVVEAAKLAGCRLWEKDEVESEPPQPKPKVRRRRRILETGHPKKNKGFF